MKLWRGHCWVILLGWSSSAFADHNQRHTVSATSAAADVQREIVEYYSQGDCSSVRKLVRDLDWTVLRPNVMAVAASCEPPTWPVPQVFARAEELSPSGDLILVLHAKWLTPYDEQAARPIWQRVMIVSRNEYFTGMARDALAGIAPRREPMDLSPNTFFAEASLGVYQTSDVRPTDFTYLPERDSRVGVFSGRVSGRTWHRGGSTTLNVGFKTEQVFEASDFDQSQLSGDMPFALHVARAKDIVFRPFGNLSYVGARRYRDQYGLGVKGVVYKNNYVQSVQAMVYSEHIHVQEIDAEQGAHYRFEYEWEKYPLGWILSGTMFIEHTQGGRAATYVNQAGDFEMNHNDMGLVLRITEIFDHLSWGIDPEISYRIDSDNSHYTNRHTGLPVDEQREDFRVKGKLWVSVPLGRQIQALGWLEGDRTWSTCGIDDYVNKNQWVRSAGLGLKISLSSY